MGILCQKEKDFHKQSLEVQAKTIKSQIDDTGVHGTPLIRNDVPKQACRQQRKIQ